MKHLVLLQCASWAKDELMLHSFSSISGLSIMDHCALSVFVTFRPLVSTSNYFADTALASSEGDLSGVNVEGDAPFYANDSENAGNVDEIQLLNV